MKRKAHLIYLTKEEEASLRKLATKHQTLSPHGPTAGKPSFRVLIQDVARGQILLTPTKRVPA